MTTQTNVISLNVNSSKLTKYSVNKIRFNMIRLPLRRFLENTTKPNQIRNFLSQAYYCNEVWENRLNNRLLKPINPNELYFDIEQRYNKTKTVSAIDVDVFANTVRGDAFVDELLDVMHKLRLGGDSINTLNSTSHAVVRYLVDNGRKEELLQVLDDRLNYGLFLDNYTANLLLDKFWKEKDYASGARIAIQIMLQEEFGHPLTTSLSLVHCYNFLLKPKSWVAEETKEETEEEEVKVRVKYLKNPYFDDHFDLRDPLQLVGKTLVAISKHLDKELADSFFIVGSALHGKTDVALNAVKKLKDKNALIYQDVLNLLPEENEVRKASGSLETKPENMGALLEEEVKKAERKIGERDIVEQCETFSKWEIERERAVEEQKNRILREERLANVEEKQKELKDREQKLWFFENEEKFELDIEAKKIYYRKKWFGKRKKPRKVDQDYIPPEI